MTRKASKPKALARDSLGLCVGDTHSKLPQGKSTQPDQHPQSQKQFSETFYTEAKGTYERGVFYYHLGLRSHINHSPF